MFAQSNLDVLRFVKDRDAVLAMFNANGMNPKSYKWRFARTERNTTFASGAIVYVDPTDQYISTWGANNQVPSWKSGSVFVGRVRVSKALITNFVAVGEFVLTVQNLKYFFDPAAKAVDVNAIYRFVVDAATTDWDVFDFFCQASSLLFEFTGGGYDIRPYIHFDGIVITPQQ